MNRLKAGDHVIVIAGKDKGRTGNVIKLLGDGDSVLVENINMAKRHTRPNPSKNEPGGIIEREMPIDASNVAHYNAVSKKADRVGFRVLEDGTKVRYYKSNGEVVDV